jgi:hypothetical protein
VTAELLRYCDQVVLNVRADNPPAIAAYRRLGYEEYCRFEERLVRRTSPSWPDLVGPVRRLFAGLRSNPVEPPRPDQAHPLQPNPSIPSTPPEPPPASPETGAPSKEPT